MVQFIGLDVGRRNVKPITFPFPDPEDRIIFRSSVGEWRKRNLEDDRDYEVEIDGQKYFVADLAQESLYEREMTTPTKVHMETKVLFLTALALVAKEEHLVVTTGLPINQHTESMKKALTTLLCGHHEVRINSAPMLELNVDDLGIVGEGLGMYWHELLDGNGNIQNEWLATQRIVRGIELGSRTTNVFTVVYDPVTNKRHYLDKESDTLDYGYIALQTEEPDDEALEAFSRKVTAGVSKIWLTYKPIKDVVIIGGGGALTLGQWLKRQYPISLISKEPLFGNALGFCEMGMIRCQNEQNRNLR